MKGFVEKWKQKVKTFQKVIVFLRNVKVVFSWTFQRAFIFGLLLHILFSHLGCSFTLCFHIWVARSHYVFTFGLIVHIRFSHLGCSFTFGFHILGCSFKLCFHSEGVLKKQPFRFHIWRQPFTFEAKQPFTFHIWRQDFTFEGTLSHLKKLFHIWSKSFTFSWLKLSAYPQNASKPL